MTQTLAIACQSGGYRVSFIMGVLSAFEAAGLRADAYAGTSASAVPAALATIGQIGAVAPEYGKSMVQYKALGQGMSGVALESLKRWGPFIRERLFQPGMPRLCVPTSAVITPEAAEQTQGKQARRLGRTLLLAAAQHDRTWANANLRLELFDTASADPALRLTPENVDEVAYASTRMLHAWDIPAWIAGRPYIDGSYTCACAALEMADLGYDEVIAIATDASTLHRDFFGDSPIPGVWKGVPIQVVRPSIDPGTLGADFTEATEAGVAAVYRHGEEVGRQFLAQRH